MSSLPQSLVTEQPLLDLFDSGAAWGGEAIYLGFYLLPRIQLGLSKKRRPPNSFSSTFIYKPGLSDRLI